MRSISKTLWVAGMTIAALPVLAQQLPLEPRHDAGQSITGVFEGWFRNADGSFGLLFGYLNRNLKEDADIAIGANNHIDPGGPDRGQPTHFSPGRMWGDFTITVPADFGTSKLNWTIVANGKTTVIPASLKPDWELSPFVDATGNTPPFISFESFEESGPLAQGPRGVTDLQRSHDRSAAFIDHLDRRRYRGLARDTNSENACIADLEFVPGPGPVAFSAVKPLIEKVDGKMPPKATFAGKATTEATFAVPGEYVLQVMANDASGEGGGGFQCCWTTAHVKVLVNGGAATGGR